MLPLYSPRTAEMLFNIIRESLQGRISVELRPSLALSMAIFLNNLRVALISLLLGFTVLGPLVIVSGNGAILGLVASYAVVRGSPPLVVAASILPHGVIELSAIIYVVALSVELGVRFWRWLLYRSREGLEEFLRGLPRGLATVIVLLFVAALVEGMVTPLVVVWVKSLL